MAAITRPEKEATLVDVVIVIDTSPSMKDKIDILNHATEAGIKKASFSCRCDLRIEWFGIEGTWDNTNFQQVLREYLVTTCGIDETELRSRKRGEVPANGAQEDGARAIEDISTHFNWRDGATRSIFYLGDEALEGGGDTEEEDIAAANRAIEKARNAGVVVHTYFGKSKSQGQDKTAAEYVRLAQETGGHGFRNQNAIGGFAEILKTVICSTRNRDTTPQLVPVIPVYFVQAQHLVGFSATSTQSSTSSTPQNKSVDLVIVIDTSVSMKDEAEGLSNAAEAAIKNASSSCPSDLRVEWFGLEGTWKNTNFQQTLRAYLINSCGVAETEIRGRKRGEIPGGGAQEDGARAIEDISTHFNWRDGASRAIFYLSDEALEGGDDTEQEDIEAANRAIEKAKSAGAIVHTYFGTSKSKGRDKTAAEFARVAQETGGRGFTDKDALGGFGEILTQIICVSSEAKVEETGQLIPVVPLYFAAVVGGALVSQSTQMTTVQPTNPTASVASAGGLFSLAAPNLVAAPQSSISTTAVNMPIYMMAVQPTNSESDRAT
ncbi:MULTISPECIES: hypothetical protein [unclassified Microcoleus]|uniref:hypothetical protein n=1 Tax=unclassified Microcoleus TaxID=2642155 RepID=UPI002FD3ABE4